MRGTKEGKKEDKRREAETGKRKEDGWGRKRVRRKRGKRRRKGDGEGMAEY